MPLGTEIIRTLFAVERKNLKENYGGVVTTKAKHRWFWRLLDKICYVISFGKSRDFMRRATTIGPVIAYGEQVDLQAFTKVDYITFRHEVIHVKQYAQCGLGEPTVGILLFLLLYLFVPLPAWRSWFRYKFERDAFLEEYRTARKCGWTPNVEDFVTALSGPDYLYAWPKEKVKAWFEKAIAKL
jgi:hypothetical protein